MHHTVLTVAVSPSVRVSIDPLVEAVIASWPAGRTPPTIRTRTFDDILDSTVFPADAFLIVFGLEDRAMTAFKIADRLQSALRSGVMLFPEVGPDQRNLETGGMIIEPIDAERSHLASLLFALIERQHAVNQLGTELKTASLVHGGIETEMEALHDELNLAAVVQKEFIPRTLPEVPGFDIGVLFRPAGYVSGDIYDIARLDEDHIGFLLADAVGHGVPAALLTMVISKSLRKIEYEADGSRRLIPPAEAMEHLNDEMCERQDASQRFATAVYGVINLRTNRVTIAGAGHPAPLRIQEGGVEPVETRGPLLGVFKGAEYDQTSFQIEPGESLLIYSDGFETAFPRSGADNHEIRLPTQTYLDHLSRVGAGTGFETLSEAMCSLESLLIEQVGSLHQADDITAIAIHRSSDEQGKSQAA